MSFTCEDPTAKVTFSEGLKMKKELAMSLVWKEDTPTKRNSKCDDPETGKGIYDKDLRSQCGWRNPGE